MSLRSLPLIVLALIMYNVVVMLGGGAPAADVLAQKVFTLPLVGRGVTVTWGDVIIMVTLILLFIEVVKSTYSSSASLVDHALSMIVFVACLVEFLLVANAATGVFLNITLAAMIDVVAGYTIGIRVARRDLSIGGDA
jgi:hypothetical protein